MPKYGYLVVEGPHDIELVYRLLSPFGVDASRLLSEWSGPDGFLRKVGTRGPGVHYVLASLPEREN
jgi:hypothetical protein